ncbi:DUF6193 family natural product biosynthesis protein [Streptomyces virginiae]|uniref:DUF6193 family natural product biosynthesis protein n=1 Tax=Streptomyces virginiae TaxID=1961 RepID=UPI0036ED2FC2
MRRPDRPYPPVVPLLEAAYAHPRLRRLFPFTSHYSLNLSSCTEHPYLVQVPSVDPMADGRFRVRSVRSAHVIGWADTAGEAVALVAAHIPPGLGPAVAHRHHAGGRFRIPPAPFPVGDARRFSSRPPVATVPHL